MFTVEAAQSKRLLVISYAQNVTGAETDLAFHKVEEILKDFEPGFSVLTDMRWLVSMEPAAAAHIARIMKAVAAKKVALIVRVIPDPQKDIGFNILSQFHYDDSVRRITFQTLADALECLATEAASDSEKANEN